LQHPPGAGNCTFSIKRTQHHQAQEQVCLRVCRTYVGAGCCKALTVRAYHLRQSASAHMLSVPGVLVHAFVYNLLRCSSSCQTNPPALCSCILGCAWSAMHALVSWQYSGLAMLHHSTSAPCGDNNLGTNSCTRSLLT
jgi:hypothetical protein